MFRFWNVSAHQRRLKRRWTPVTAGPIYSSTHGPNTQYQLPGPLAEPASHSSIALCFLAEFRMGLAPGRPSFCNIKTKHLKHKQIKNKKYIKKFNVTSYFEGIKFPLQHQTHVSCNIFKHHPNQNACNDTSGIDKTFQHFNQTLATCLRNTYAACATPPRKSQHPYATSAAYL